MLHSFAKLSPIHCIHILQRWKLSWEGSRERIGSHIPGQLTMEIRNVEKNAEWMMGCIRTAPPIWSIVQFQLGSVRSKRSPSRLCHKKNIHSKSMKFKRNQNNSLWLMRCVCAQKNQARQLSHLSWDRSRESVAVQGSATKNPFKVNVVQKESILANEWWGVCAHRTVNMDNCPTWIGIVPENKHLSRNLPNKILIVNKSLKGIENLWMKDGPCVRTDSSRLSIVPVQLGLFHWAGCRESPCQKKKSSKSANLKNRKSMMRTQKSSWSFAPFE